MTQDKKCINCECDHSGEHSVVGSCKCGCDVYCIDEEHKKCSHIVGYYCKDCNEELLLCHGCSKKFNRGNRIICIEFPDQQNHFHSKTCLINFQIKCIKDYDYSEVM